MSFICSSNNNFTVKDNFLGVCYSPTHYGQPDDFSHQITLQAYGLDFPKIAQAGFQVVRCYRLPGDLGPNNDNLANLDQWYAFVYQAYKNNLKVILEIPVNPNETGKGDDGKTPYNDYFIDVIFETYLSNILENFTPPSKYPLTNFPVTRDIFNETVICVLAGNENIPANPMDNSLVTLKTRLEAKLQKYNYLIPVSYCLRCDVMAGNPVQYPNRKTIVESLSPGVPLFVTCYPYEWGVSIDNAIQGEPNSLKYYSDIILGFYPKLKLALGETGWATYNPPEKTPYTLPPYPGNSKPIVHPYQGTMAIASIENAKNYFLNVHNKYQGINYSSVLYFEAFDEPSKVSDDAPMQFQRYYGVWTGGPTSSSHPILKYS